MKSFSTSVVLVVLFAGISVSASEPEHKDSRDQHRVEVKPLNSPVKEANARFLLVLPASVSPTIKNARFQIKAKGKGPSQKLVAELLKHEQKVSLNPVSGGLEAAVSMRELGPGKYEIHFKLKPDHSLWKKLNAKFFGKEEKEHGQNFGELHGEADFALDASLEVPDPGKAGMQTLAGIDSDKDGIRDDVQRWINEMYSASAKRKAGAKQMARDFQARLLSYQNKEQSIALGHQYFLSMDCMIYVLGSSAAEAIFGHELEARMLNTRGRIQAKIQNSVNFNGQTSTPEERDDNDKAKCRFDADSLLN